MALLIYTLSSILTFFLIARPVQLAIARAEQKKFRENFRLFKLKNVRKYYPELHRLSYEEIAERFNVTELYDRLTYSGDS